MNADFSTDYDGNGEVYQAFYFQGLRLDGNSGNHHARNRDHRASLGRWTQNDPAGYVDGSSKYVFTKSSPLGFVDPFGQKANGDYGPIGFSDSFGIFDDIGGIERIFHIAGHVVEWRFELRWGGIWAGDTLKLQGAPETLDIVAYWRGDKSGDNINIIKTGLILQQDPLRVQYKPSNEMGGGPMYRLSGNHYLF